MATLRDLSQLSGSMDCGDFILRDLDTRKPFCYIDYANKIEIKETANSQFAKAKGKDSIEFQEPTTWEISMDVEMWSPSLLGVIHGGQPTEGMENISRREKKTVSVNDGDVVINGIPYADNVDVFVLGEDEVTHIRELTDITYNREAKTITCTGATQGDVLAIYYWEESECLTNVVQAVPDSKEFFEMEGTIRQKTKAKGKTTLLNLLAKKVSISGTVTLSFDTSKPNGFTITMNVLEDNNGDLARLRTLAQSSNSSSTITVLPISDLEVISQSTNSAVLTFSKPIGATSVSLKYSTDEGATWEDVNTEGSSSVISIPEPLTANSKNVTVSNLTTGDYIFELVVVGGAFSGTSNKTTKITIA